MTAALLIFGLIVLYNFVNVLIRKVVTWAGGIANLVP